MRKTTYTWIGGVRHVKDGGDWVPAPETSTEREAANARVKDMGLTRRAPGIAGTDAINFRGIASGNPFPNMRPNDAARYMAEAKRLGIDVNGKRYMTSLVRPEYKGRIDPEAFVDSTLQVKRVLESRGWGTDDECDSMVKVKPRPIEAECPLDQPYAPDDSLVHEKLYDEITAAGETKVSKKEYRKMFEKKKTQLTGAVNDG